MSFQKYYMMGQHVTCLNRACVKELRQHHPFNQQLFDAKHLIFEIRCEMEENYQNYSKLYCKLCQAHELYFNVIGKKCFI